MKNKLFYYKLDKFETWVHFEFIMCVCVYIWDLHFLQT